MHTYAEGEITLAGIRLTLDEWESLDSEERHLLLQVAVAGEHDESLVLPAARVPAMIDLLTRAS